MPTITRSKLRQPNPQTGKCIPTHVSNQLVTYVCVCTSTEAGVQICIWLDRTISSWKSRPPRLSEDVNFVWTQKIKHLTSPRVLGHLSPGEVSTAVNVNKQSQGARCGQAYCSALLWVCFRVYRNTLPPTAHTKATVSSVRCTLVLFERQFHARM